MGRTTSNGLTSADRTGDFPRELMAPEKAWNLESLLPCNFKTAADSFPEILWDDYLHMEFQEILNSGVQKGLCEKIQVEAGSEIERTSEFLNLLSVVNGNKKIGAGDKESLNLTLKDMLVGDFHENTTLSDADLLDDKVTDIFVAGLIIHDHSYADLQCKPQDMCSDNFMFGKTEDSSNQSATCSNPKLGIDEQVLDSCTEFSKNYIGFKPLSPASSTSSLTADLASSSSYSILSGDESDDMLMMTSSPLPSSDPAFTSTHSMLSQKLKQFKSRSPLPPSDQAFTSTPSSLSQNHKQFKARTPRQINSQEQHRFLNFRSKMNNKQPSKELAADSFLGNCSMNSKAIATDSYLTNYSLKSKEHAADSHLTNYTINSDGVLPVFSTSSLDWDGPETMSETPYDNSDTEVPVTTFSNHASNVANLLQGVLHDHDYCSKVRFDSGSKKLAPLNPRVNTGMFKNVKRTYTKKSKINGMNEKIMKAKYLKKELLKRDSSLKPVLNHKPKLTGPILTKPISKPVGRQRKRVFNKVSEEDLNPETEKKLKITGKFQDQYVYYLAKSSRTSSRGRQKSSLNSDKNLASVPKPEDIVIPHLTDADIEAVRLKGRDALKQPARQHSTGASPPPVPFQSASCFSDNSVEHLYDVDSHIVSTILSMESDSVSYPASQAPVISTAALNLSQPSIISTSSLNPSQPSVISTSTLNLDQSADMSTSALNLSQSADMSTSTLNLIQSADITTSSVNLNQPSVISTSSVNLNQPSVISTSSVNLNQPSVISTSSLNPNQPALTESLRLMSGDPTITSEHVLNYLLTLVKDNGFTDSAESGTAVLFPPSVSDSINMAYQAEQTEGMLYEDTNVEYVSSGEEFLHMMNSVEISSSDEVLHHGVQNNANHCFQPPHSDCVTDRTLLDDLSSMLESKEVFPSGDLHSDSSSSVKKTFKPNPCSEETTQAASSVDKLRSIEKTIDYLYRKDDVFDHTHAESSLVTTPVPDDTPWIVTITLYFNDVPAIMINNQPYIRLVDIYKQILPAKDTGILKKRCQLMNIPILSCTEMQRYFLVQYGKACNSKSTIIVSKDHAADLIEYYTTPQSRAGRMSQDKKIQPGRSICHKTARSSSDERGSKKTSSSQRLSVPKDPGKPPYVFENAFDISEVSSVSYGKQRMHKNSNYQKGQRKDNSSVSTNASTFESVVKTASSQTCNKHSIKLHRNTKMKQYSKGDVSRICSYIHHQKNRKKRHGHKAGKKHRTNDVNSEINTKLPKKVFLEADHRTSLGLPQSDKETVKYKVKSKKCTHKKGSHHQKDLSSSAMSAAPGRPLPSLPVKHQSVLSENGVESQLPPQAANLYVDLFVRPESECVRCATCSQHLSVSHFMRHHHVPSDSRLLAAEATPRILVPLNSMDEMSKQEQRLWRKFQRLQKSVGSSNCVDDGTDSEYHHQNIFISPKSSSSSLLHLDQPLQFMDHKRKRKLSSQLSSSSCHVEYDENPDSLAKRQKFSSTSTPSASSSHKHASEAISDLVTRDNTQIRQLSEVPAGSKISSLRDGRLAEGDVLSPRTSARKRKSKQLFSIEDY